MTIQFEDFYTIEFENTCIVDFQDFWGENIEGIEDMIKQSIILSGNRLTVGFTKQQEIIVDDKFANKHIANIWIDFHENKEYAQFRDEDITSDLADNIEARDIQLCIDSNNDCSYIKNYSCSFDLEIELLKK